MLEIPGRFKQLRVPLRTIPTVISCQHDLMVPSYDQHKIMLNKKGSTSAVFRFVSPLGEGGFVLDIYRALETTSGVVLNRVEDVAYTMRMC